MFDTHEKCPGKMKFQKPNILRKSPKKSNKAPVIAKLQTQDQTLVEFTKMPECHSPKYTKHKCSKPAHFSKKSLQRIKLDSHISEENKMKMVHNKVNYRSEQSGTANNVYVQINNNDDLNTVSSSKNLQDRSFNIEDCVFDVEGITLKSFEEISSDTNWCFIPLQRQKTEEYVAVVNRNDTAQVPFEGNSFLPQSTLVVLDSNVAAAPETTNTAVSIELLPSSPVTFTCDIPECGKVFLSKQKLRKHTYVHNKDYATKVLKQLAKCPAVRPGGQPGGPQPGGPQPGGPQPGGPQPGAQPCGLLFCARGELLKHLKQYHTLEDAVHSCSECGRRFFWAGSVRAHARSCGARGRPPLACAWPGCGRVFLQPCRLKEHSRAHTGDKPYPCLYPECRKSFRTASKLLRHERQHTGERRHRCEVCGRAFLRAEHLRDHRARHERARGGGAESSTTQEAPELKQESPEPAGWAGPAGRAGRPELKQESPGPAGPAPSGGLEAEGAEWSDTEDPFLSAPAATAESSDVERSARTHLTWPLAPAPAPPPPPPAPAPAPVPAPALEEAVMVLEGDVQVELAEGAESKIYTIRSDLFLHGNILYSEDSESGVVSGGLSAAEADPPLESELGLLDHSAIELMQDSLLYAAGAVDDASFQLLGGDLHVSSFYAPPPPPPHPPARHH